jgi:hypothetical protein
MIDFNISHCNNCPWFNYYLGFSIICLSSPRSVSNPFKEGNFWNFSLYPVENLDWNYGMRYCLIKISYLVLICFIQYGHHRTCHNNLGFTEYEHGPLGRLSWCFTGTIYMMSWKLHHFILIWYLTLLQWCKLVSDWLMRKRQK